MRTSGYSVGLFLVAAVVARCHALFPFQPATPGADRGPGEEDRRDRNGADAPHDAVALDSRRALERPSACDGIACQHFKPSNVIQQPAKACSGPWLGTFDTTTCTTGPCTTLEDGRCIVRFATLVLPAGTKRGVIGKHALVLLVDGEVRIEGTLDAGAHGNVPGPGGFKGGIATVGSSASGTNGLGPGAGKTCGVCTLDPDAHDDCGGGGAGHAKTGGQGGAEQGLVPIGCPSGLTPALGGPATTSWFSAGSGGASGGNRNNSTVVPGEGGAGGGLLQISAQGPMIITGVISAGGGGGRAATNTGLSAHSGGGGGGSGGTILLEAPQISGTGWVVANGGGGGGGMSQSQPEPPPQNGADGLDDKQALGGDSPSSGNGGPGGTATIAAGAGEAESSGGGGGGGAGFVVLRTYPNLPLSVKVSGVKPASVLPLAPVPLSKDL